MTTRGISSIYEMTEKLFTWALNKKTNKQNKNKTFLYGRIKSMFLSYNMESGNLQLPGRRFDRK